MYPSGDSDWGFGAYYLPDSVEIGVYLNTEGYKFGTLNKGKYSSQIFDNEGNNIKIHTYDRNWLGGGVELIKTSKSNNPDFVKVFWKTNENGLFL